MAGKPRENKPRPSSSRPRSAPGERGPSAHAKGGARARGGPPRALRIESIAAGGAGVARDEGRAVFVPRAAPGDLVEAVIEARGGALHGRLLRVIEAGSSRVDPPCRFAEACGGCDLMHLSAAAQREAHRAIVEDALRRVGGFSTAPAIATHVVSGEGAGLELAYRTRARLHARSERGRLAIGYRAAGSHDLVAIDRCAVLVPALDALIATLPAALDRARGDGEISIALGDGGRPVVDVAWRGELPKEVWARLDERVRSGAWAGARVWLDGASTPASFGDARPVIEGADGRPVVIAAGGFAQPSSLAAAVIARRAAELVRKSGEPLGTIVELFAGSGALSILLAPLSSRFVAVEQQEDAVRAARQNLASRGLEGKVTCADAGAFDPGRADVVVLDPPRTGARAAVERIAASGARAVVYVACDPITMARDLAVLAGSGYTLCDVELVESFPQTSHVETLVRLVRGRR